MQAPDYDFHQLMENIYRTLGFNAKHYEVKHFKRRIGSRLRATKSPDYRSYLGLLKSDSSEREKLKEALTVNVTEFFRNPEVYEVLQKKVLPEFLQRRSLNGGVLRIWSLACATGEEPHSVAMLVADILGTGKYAVGVEITATDIDTKALEAAKKGVYREVLNIPPDYINRYMNRLPDGRYAMKKEIKDMITFRKHDIFADEPPRNIDIILCRNVIIYFNKESTKYLYRLMNNSLVDRGCLVLGKSEAFIRHREFGFKIMEMKSHIFEKERTISQEG